MELRERVSRVRKHVPPEDEASWFLALIFALGLLIYVWLGRR